MEYLLLAELMHRPASGYDLRKRLQNGAFSDSPGSVYPAVKRLADRGLIEAGRAAGRRRRTAFRATEAGRRALLDWARAAVDVADLRRDARAVELRYAVLGEHGTPAELRAFLVQYADAVAAHLGAAQAEYEALPRSNLAKRQMARLAIDVLLARHTWAVRSFKELS
ncbi:MAG TPA: PadR family transcriptional regulator [Longimicrobiales bacterium]|nr:PadR family transcriptional regulator [Longimicrobiales bacterium]